MDSRARNGILHRRSSIRTLEALASASAYNELIFRALAEFIDDRALETGFGGRLCRGFACCRVIGNRCWRKTLKARIRYCMRRLSGLNGGNHTREHDLFHHHADV